MKSKYLLLYLVIALFSLFTFAENTILDDLNSENRVVRKNAQKRVEAMSKEKLVSLANECSSLLSNPDKKSNPWAAYTVHYILSTAQQKGFDIDDIINLIQDDKPDISFKVLLLDWLKELGLKNRQPTELVKILSVLRPYFCETDHDLKLRKIAHATCRDITWKLKGFLDDTSGNVEIDSEEQRLLIKKTISQQISDVCNIILNANEKDEVIGTFAPFVGYYRIYSNDGYCDNEVLKMGLQLILKDKKRSPECKNVVANVFSKYWDIDVNDEFETIEQ